MSKVSVVAQLHSRLKAYQSLFDLVPFIFNPTAYDLYEKVVHFTNVFYFYAVEKKALRFLKDIGCHAENVEGAQNANGKLLNVDGSDLLTNHQISVLIEHTRATIAFRRHFNIILMS
jgi:hypothetical protein